MAAERAMHDRLVQLCASAVAPMLIVTGVFSAAAQGTDGQVGDRGPVLLLVLTAGGGEAADRERRLFSELELALDGFKIETVPSGDPEFARLPMSDQLSRVQPFVERTGAVATTWVEETGAGTVLLHLVALTTGRALVRIVQASEGPDTEAELALSVRELLGEAYMFGPAPENPAMEQVVAEVQEKVAPAIALIPTPPIEPPQVEEPRPTPSLGLAPLGLVVGGIWGHEGPHIRAGGGIVVEWPPGADLYGRASFVFTKGPDGQVSDGLLVGFGVAPGLALGYRFSHGPIGVGPLLGVSVPYSSMTMVLGEGDDQTFGWWSFRATAGLELAVTVADDVCLFVDGVFGMQAIRESFERRSDESTVLATPFVEWEFAIGLMVFIG
ncbi:MAG: hypothetical protein JRF63_01935 [Deltaproteobacteria bacterium]|nr:hypothetical protein [Deltaproteobacteria bacterium]